LAGVNVGKSMGLVWLASQALLAGYNVAYYTLELSDTMTGLRFDSCLAKHNLTELIEDIDGDYRKVIGNKLKEVRNRTNKNVHLIIKEYPTKSASVNTIRNHLINLKHKGIVPDLVCVDYADLLRSSQKYKDKRYELEAIVEELRGLAKEYNVALWSASQSNRLGLNSRILDLIVISEALAKAMVADVVLSIGIDYELNSQKKACYFLAKNRIGKNKLAFIGTFNTDILELSMDYPYDPKNAEQDMRIDNIAQKNGRDKIIASAVKSMIDERFNTNSP